MNGKASAFPSALLKDHSALLKGPAACCGVSERIKNGPKSLPGRFPAACGGEAFKPFSILLLLVIVAGCAAPAVQKARVTTPRENAASQLTLQGIQLLEAGKPDQALRTFEQAVGLDPNNGENYFYIAQAWLAKGRIPQAREFNRLAGDYLKDEQGWADRLDRQAAQIERRAR